MKPEKDGKRRRTVAVVGGGIAGLALAAALDPATFSVTVYEAQPQRADSGAAVGIWPSARRALAFIGAADPLQRGDPRFELALHDLAGRPLVRSRRASVMLVDRAALLAALEAAVPKSVRREHTAVTDPASLDADLVVGADGVRSRVRPLVWRAAAERRATPWVALRGTAPESPEPTTVGEYWGARRLFGVIPLSGRRTYWFSTHVNTTDPEPLDPARVVAEARRIFATAAPAVRSLLSSADSGAIATRLWVTRFLPRYVAGRYVVIGDAAHAMTPNLGRGACSALVDAVLLARALNRGRSLRWWQARRVPATQFTRIASELVMRLALSGVTDRPGRRSRKGAASRT